MKSETATAVGRYLAGALLLVALGFLVACTASRGSAAKEEPAGISVHLPVTETMEIESRPQPPVVQPEMTPPPPHPADAHEEGKARSLDLLHIHPDGGTPGKPAGGAPHEEPGKP